MTTGIERPGRSSLRARIVVVGAGLALLAGLVAAPGVARADAGANASCMGHEASAISPPGSYDEFPGGLPELKSLTGHPFGGTISGFAQLREGSHEACDAAG